MSIYYLMPSKSVENKAKKAITGSPLGKLRSLIGWTRQECANHAGVSLASLQNYERGFAPLPLEVARALESTCGVNAEQLHEQSKIWHESRGKTKPQNPVTMGGNTYTADAFKNYCSAQISSHDQAKAIKDISTRVNLLLGALGEKPHIFRTAYRALVQDLDSLLKQTGLSVAEMSEFASQGAKVEEMEWTLGELGAEPAVAQSPDWIKADLMKKFSILDKVKIQKTEFDFWPPAAVSFAQDQEKMTPDWILCKRHIWRITLPDQSLLTIPFNQFEASGLLARTSSAAPSPHGVTIAESRRNLELTHFTKTKN
jgi:transcriptional regulator with XRE-family HTH domain